MTDVIIGETMPDLDTYTTICNGRFNAIEETNRKIADNVTEIKQKIFNGHSEAITSIQNDIRAMREGAEKRKRSKSLFARDIILTLLGSGGIVSLILMQIFR